MLIKLSQTQRALLSAAREREDQCLTPPAGANLAQVRNTAAKLKAAGLVKEIKAKADAPVWRQDKSTGQVYSLKLTAVGLKAIAAVEAEEVTPQAPGDANARARRQDAIDPATAVNTVEARDGLTLVPPRQRTKLAAVVTLLQGQRGATLDQLVKANGWLPHTTRAALTNLRKRGYAVTLDQSDRGHASVYRIARELVSGEENTSAAVANIANAKDAVLVSSEAAKQGARGSRRRQTQSRSSKAKAHKAA